MNIYSQPGQKVEPIFKDGILQNSTNLDNQRCSEWLKENEIYTIEKIVNHNYSTDVYLKEFPGVRFNSIHFNNIGHEHII